MSLSQTLAQGLRFSTFILAGMDTTSNATARLLHLLAMHPDVQERLREEILEAQAGDEVPYDHIMELPYLDAVCRETLRLCVDRPTSADSSSLRHCRYAPVRLILRRLVACLIFRFYLSYRTPHLA